MFCPKCGKGEQAPKSYCRACGDWLPDVSKLTKRPTFGNDTPEQNINTTIFFNALGAIFTLFIIFAIYSTAFGVGVPALGSYYSILLFIAGAFAISVATWQIINALSSFKLQRRMLQRKLALNQNNQLNSLNLTNYELSAADTANLVCPVNNSVTESTTTLLEPILNKSTNKFE